MTEYENSAFLISPDEGIAYEIEYNDKVEVRNLLSHAPGLKSDQLLDWLRDEDYDVDFNPILTDRAGATEENDVRNFVDNK